MPLARSLGACLLAPPMLHPKARRLVVHDDLAIEFLALWPIYREEMEFKLEHGVEALMERFARTGVTDLIEVGRGVWCESRR